MPPLAVIEPVNRKLISIIEKNPAIYQVMALARSLTLLSIGAISARGVKLPLVYRATACVHIMRICCVNCTLMLLICKVDHNGQA